MTTFGPVQIAADTDDGQELDDTTWDVNGLDSDGNVVGRRSGTTSYDMGMRWDNVTIPQGATINSAIVEMYSQFGQGDPLLVTWAAFDEDDTAAFGSSARPSQRAQTSGIDQDWSVDNGGVFNSSIDLAAIVQTVIDRAGWASGNALGIVCKDRSNGSQIRHQFIDYAQSPTNSATLTIVYTAAAPETVPLTKANLAIAPKTLTAVTPTIVTLTRATLGITANPLAIKSDELVPLAVAAIGPTARPLGVNAREVVPIAKAAWALAGRPFAISVGERVPMVKVPLALAPGAFEVLANEAVPMTKAAFSYTGKPLGAIEGSFAVMTRVSFDITTRPLAVKANEVIAMARAHLVWSGGPVASKIRRLGLILVDPVFDPDYLALKEHLKVLWQRWMKRR